MMIVRRVLCRSCWSADWPECLFVRARVAPLGLVEDEVAARPIARAWRDRGAHDLSETADSASSQECRPGTLTSLRTQGVPHDARASFITVISRDRALWINAHGKSAETGSNRLHARQHGGAVVEQSGRSKPQPTATAQRGKPRMVRRGRGRRLTRAPLPGETPVPPHAYRTGSTVGSRS
jgi:hypothetical protein